MSLLSHISKFFERILYKQITSYMNDVLSVYITGFQNLHGNQHCLVKMLENWKIPPVPYLWISQKLLILLTMFCY